MAYLPSNLVLEVGAQVAAAANNQTLAGAASLRTYIAGFTVTGGGATAASVIQVTVTGLTNPLSFNIAIPAGAAVGVFPLQLEFDPPLPASADNTAIVVNVPSFGAGNTNASASAWGFQA
jgi:hypothetical protein